MTEYQATAIIKAIEQLADNMDLRDKPNHPLNKISKILEGMSSSLRVFEERLNEIAGELCDIRKNKM